LITNQSSNKPLSSFVWAKGGAFAPLFKQFLEAALDAELENHLDDSQQQLLANRKNGKTSKRLKTNYDELELVTSRDRTGCFEPEIIKKRETILADSYRIVLTREKYS
jgi:transposase-like protein